MKTKWIEVFIILSLLTLVSICFAAWDNTKPADNSVWNNAAGEIRANWDALEVVLGVDLADFAGTIDFNDIDSDNIKTKFTPCIDVTHPDYGADPTGATDSTAALQAAIDDATAYGTVVLPPGTYLFSQLKFYNPIVFRGLGGVAGRWDSLVSGVTLLHDESANPAIIIGGTSDSVITTGAYYIAEGITLANFLLYPTGATANVGILVDGSTSIYANRACTRDICFENVDVRVFGGNNIKFLGGAFDIRFRGGGSRAKYTDGVVTETATYYAGGTSTPGQLHFYDFYSQAFPGDWNFKGHGIRLYGGGCAYGNGFYAESSCHVYGTHFEGLVADPASIGLQIVGQYGIFYPGIITSHDTAIIIGDGTATVSRHNFISTTVSAATLGVEITDGGSRKNSGVIYFTASVTTDIQDDRAGTDSAYNEFQLLNDTRRIETIATLANEATPSVGDSMGSAGIFETGGVIAITDFDDGYIGQIITVMAQHNITITDGANIVLDGGANFAMTSGDTLTLFLFTDDKWYQMSESDNN